MRSDGAESGAAHRLRRRRRFSRGFTAIELLGAFAISVVLSVVAVSSYRVFQRDLPLRSAAHRISYAFSTARTFAISRNATFTVQIDRQFNNFWIDQTDRFGNIIVPKVTRPEAIDKRAIVDQILFGQGAGFVQGPIVGTRTPILFFPDGSSDQVSVLLKEAVKAASTNPGDIVTVRLYGPTGQTRVFEGGQVLPLSAQP